MCIAVPMKLIDIDQQNHIGTVLYSGNTINVNLSLVSPKIGDYLLIHAGCAIEIMELDMAEEMLAILQMLELAGRSASLDIACDSCSGLQPEEIMHEY